MSDSRMHSLDGSEYDVVVIGGGATGASATQNLAARGFRVLLVDQGDFASGTSSRSSRLLYCGLAYFSPDYPLWRALFHPREMLQRVRMARLAMKCRTELATTAPERVTACEFVFPVKRNSAYPRWKVALGYRALSLFGSPRAPLAYRHEPTPQAARGGLVSFMNPEELAGVARFREYQYNWAERICMDAVMDAERLGARVENYVRVASFRRDGEDWALTLEPGALPGRPHQSGNHRAEVRTRFLVNAAGPWIDRVLKQGPGTGARHVIGIKGVNVMVKLPEACRGQGMETISSQDQPFYLMPWGDHHFFGPTETVYVGPPEDARVEPGEIDYILGEANRVFPGFDLGRADVVYAWCGVRPRTDDSSASGVKSFTIHDLAREGMENAITVTGTPIMVHRHAGRRIAAWVAARLRPTGTPGTLDPGARHLPSDDGPSIGGISVTSLRAAAAQEHVRTLTDLMFRRVNLGWQVGMGLPHAEAVAGAVADLLGWDATRIAQELAAYRAFVAENFHPAPAPETAA
ncbi:FAD-dependent oxidoreductase [Pseudodonghicola flavimaris]|uniref:FAD-dependent oxidoreductase n=1 Tax=Pseudodonghicola flavimaris TaxID=3050036 RepID=A0ABT7F2X5_9RHOB|nr:FAD-dependent oxidoreductase [Pseudodonghicola flavimaris]MDK3018809.1 FAD-dependent oxidoreductase [Pseudodonghicola flavimaris]